MGGVPLNLKDSLIRDSEDYVLYIIIIGITIYFQRRVFVCTGIVTVPSRQFKQNAQRWLKACSKKGTSDSL